MVGGTSRTSDAGLRVLDLAALALALPAAYELYDALPARRWTPPLAVFWPPLVVALLLWVASAWLHRVYDDTGTKPLARELARTARAFLMAALAMAAITYLLKYEGLSRLMMGLYCAIALALFAANRIALRLVVRAARRRGYHVRRYAVVGTGDLPREIVDTIAAHPEWGLELAGHVAVSGGAAAPARVLGTLDEMGTVLEEHVLDEVIFALPRERLHAVEAEVERAILLCEEQGVGVSISLDGLRYGGSSRMLLSDMGGLPMVALTRTPYDELALAAKRLFDVALSAVVLLVLSPLLFAVAAAVKLDSPGPVFFRQRRIGLNGREFVMLKFRSMHADAERRLEALRARNEMSGPAFKMRDDPRITRVGRFIRKASLDELPQFWNVLRGEMSVVGPRPPLRSEVRQYKRWQRRRLSVKPGITCTWQVAGRNDIGFDQWMELDLQYIDQWSLWHDVQICLKTIPAVLSARGAH